MKNLISASILSADMANLESEVRKLEENGIDMLHFDVMDGVFVKNISFGLPVLEAIRKITDMPLDVHLMITEPHRYVERFIKSGADILTFHVEAGSDVLETIKIIKASGIKAAISVKPATPAESVFDYLPYVDMVLVMTVEPGFGGQSFMTDMLEKIRVLRDRVNEMGLNTDIQVDGGIDGITCEAVKKAGANILVSGSYLFKAGNMAEAANCMREEVEC